MVSHGTPDNPQFVQDSSSGHNSDIISIGDSVAESEEDTRSIKFDWDRFDENEVLATILALEEDVSLTGKHGEGGPNDMKLRGLETYQIWI